MTARVELLTRPGCHLCDDARAVIAAVCADLGEQVVEHDISGDPVALSRWWDKIPVTFVDGVMHDYWRVEERRLRAALGARDDSPHAGSRPSSPPGSD